MGGQIAGTSATSYIDSPGGSEESVPYYKLTAVAVSRSDQGDRLLSTFFFEFDNHSQKLIDTGSPNYKGDLVKAMKVWGVDTGINLK
jgi:hypothetical protein